MNLDTLELAVGYGENKFTMSRGSFKYRKHVKTIKPTTLLEKEEGDGFCRLIFKENGSERKHSVRIIHHNLRTKNAEIDSSVTQKTMSEDGCGFWELIYEGEVPADINRFMLTFSCNAQEHFYGCGEIYSKLDLKGELVRIWVAEHQNTKRISKKIIREKLFGKNPKKISKFSEYESYYAQPTFVSSGKYFIHADVNDYSEFDFRKSDSITLVIQEKPHVYMGCDDSFEGLSQKMSRLLGKQKGLPKWTYDGVILASQDWAFDGKSTVSAGDGIGAIEEKIAKCKEAGIKLAGFWCQDWCGCRCTKFGYQVMWNWQFDDEKYPELPTKIKEWKQQGIRFLGYINPFIALEKNIYKEAAEKGYCVKNKKGEDYLVTITTFPAAMIDFTNPQAYNWYKELIKKNMIGIGLSGWMADFGEYLPTDAVLYSGESAELLHNRWPAIWAKMNREAIDECGAMEDVFFFTRAGYTETIRYSDIMWTGDQHVDWSLDDGIASVIPATLSLAMSGFGYTHSDVGGYTTIMHMTRSKELMLRWEEMNAFSPVMRFHEGNQPARNAQPLEDAESLSHLAKYSQIHVLLKDYLMQAVSQLEEKGTPVIKPLFYYYNEPECYEEKTEYLLGQDILVAPIIEEGAGQRKVFLPKDEWINPFTGERYSGGWIVEKAPLGVIPVYIRLYNGNMPPALLGLYDFLKNV